MSKISMDVTNIEILFCIFPDFQQKILSYIEIEANIRERKYKKNKTVWKFYKVENKKKKIFFFS